MGEGDAEGGTSFRIEHLKHDEGGINVSWQLVMRAHISEAKDEAGNCRKVCWRFLKGIKILGIKKCVGYFRLIDLFDMEIHQQ